MDPSLKKKNRTKLIYAFEIFLNLHLHHISSFIVLRASVVARKWTTKSKVLTEVTISAVELVRWVPKREPILICKGGRQSQLLSCMKWILKDPPQPKCFRGKRQRQGGWRGWRWGGEGWKAACGLQQWVSSSFERHMWGITREAAFRIKNNKKKETRACLNLQGSS